MNALSLSELILILTNDGNAEINNSDNIDEFEMISVCAALLGMFIKPQNSVAVDKME